MSVLKRAAALIWLIPVTWGQTTDFSIRVDVSVVSVDVSVTTPDGRPVDGLKADDFQLFDNGVEQPLSYFDPADAPWNVYLLLDVSGSTEDHRSFMQRVASGFLRNARRGDRIAVGVFGTEAETILGWSTSGEVSARALDWTRRNVDEGTTGFYRSLGQVLEREFGEIRERRAVIVLTDGRDASLYQTIQQQGRLRSAADDEDFQDLSKTALRARIPVYFVAMNTDVNLQDDSGGNEYRSLRILYPESDTAARYLEEVRLRMESIAGTTGGKVFLAGNPAEVVTLLEKATGALGEAYSLGWIAQSTGGQESPRTIEVRVGHPEYSVRLSRSAYVP